MSLDNTPKVSRKAVIPTTHEVNSQPDCGTWYPVDDNVAAVFQNQFDPSLERFKLFPLAISLAPDLPELTSKKYLGKLLDSVKDQISDTGIGNLWADILPDLNGQKSMLLCHHPNNSVDQVRQFMNKVIPEANKKLFLEHEVAKLPLIPPLE